MAVQETNQGLSTTIFLGGRIQNPQAFLFWKSSDMRGNCDPIVHCIGSIIVPHHCYYYHCFFFFCRCFRAGLVLQWSILWKSKYESINLNFLNFTKILINKYYQNDHNINHENQTRVTMTYITILLSMIP